MPMKLTIPAKDDLWDEANSRFISMKEQTLVLEHSLVSLSKWERKWKKPFLSTEDKTAEEWLDYFRCMTINQVNELVYLFLTNDDIQKIIDYIGDPMTATTITDVSQSNVKKEIVTSELIYYNMISYGIPIEMEKWHLNSLITLIRVFAIKNGWSKKMSESEAALFQRQLNDSRIAGKHRR